MNIKTANRLAELRKKNGYSQEELADKLGLSRQAVSKWERAESSPDTDNLILLAKLYNISLDELLETDKTEEEIIEDNKDNLNENEETNKKNKEKVYIGPKGIHIEGEDGEEVHISPFGIHINDSKRNVNTRVGDYDVCSDEHYKGNQLVNLLNAIFFIAAVVTYVCLGLFWKKYCPATNANNAGWAVGWIVFLLAPIVPSIVSAINKKRICKVNFLFMGLSAYLYIGLMTANGWHPWWCLIIISLALSAVASIVDKLIHHGFDRKDDDNYVVDVDFAKDEDDK